MTMKNKYAKRSRISEGKVRELVRYFAADLTALQAATLREKRPYCPNSDSNSLWSGLGRELSSGAEGSQRRSDYRKNLHSV